MIFVSYSHQDELAQGLRGGVAAAKRAESIRFWSDKDLMMGEWEKQIEEAMKGAVAAVLLVSDNFLASDYTVGIVLPSLDMTNRPVVFSR